MAEPMAAALDWEMHWRELSGALGLAEPKDAEEALALVQDLIRNAMPLLPLKYRLVAGLVLAGLHVFRPLIVQAVSSYGTSGE